MTALKKVLSTFLTPSKPDFKLFEKLLEDSKQKNLILDLSSKDLNLLFKFLIDHKQSLSLSKLLGLLIQNNVDFNSALALKGLILLNYFKESEQKLLFASLSISKNEAFCLLPVKHLLSDKHQSIVESALQKQRQKTEAVREDLKDQIAFLKSEQLTDKALEIEKKLRFHFPDVREDSTSNKQAEHKSKNNTFAQTIERNLSFEARSKKRQQNTEDSIHKKRASEDLAEGLKLAQLWHQELKDVDTELLLTQLEFIDIDDSDFYSKILSEVSQNKNLNAWTKLFLYIKSKNYLEGLEFLSQNEDKLLSESSDSIYNFYYTKGLLLLGLGMQKEAEEIFLLIKEQKENFRDLQALLQNVK